MPESAVLLIDCPDRRGLVAGVSSLLFAHGANILHADQHRDEARGLFFMRIEWSLAADVETGMRFEMASFRSAFEQLAAELDMRWTIALMGERPRVALFCSRFTHCLADLLHRWKSGELHCDIPLVVANHPDAESLARFYGVRFIYTPVTATTRAQVEAHQLQLLADEGVELVVLARYM